MWSFLLPLPDFLCILFHQPFISLPPFHVPVVTIHASRVEHFLPRFSFSLTFLLISRCKVLAKALCLRLIVRGDWVRIAHSEMVDLVLIDVCSGKVSRRFSSIWGNAFRLQLLSDFSRLGLYIGEIWFILSDGVFTTTFVLLNVHMIHLNSWFATISVAWCHRVGGDVVRCYWS